MRCVVGIDLGSTTTKAVLLGEDGRVLGQGITNSRSNYEVASAVARQEAHTEARFRMLSEELQRRLATAPAKVLEHVRTNLPEAFRLELHLSQLAELDRTLSKGIQSSMPADVAPAYVEAAHQVLERARQEAPALYMGTGARKSDFFKDLAAQSFVAAANTVCGERSLSFERILSCFDRAILDLERRVHPWEFGNVMRAASARVMHGLDPEHRQALGQDITACVEHVAGQTLEEVAFTGTGYGRQTLPFPPEAVRSEILCHGRGAHRVFPGTRTVLDIGGQDTKAIQVDENGVVTSFQMNDRCAAGCGRYLGYIADELNLGLHELGPLALGARKMVKVNSTCTVFAGAELKERLSLGERREDILAGLHRAIMLRAMALLARSGGVSNEFTFTGGVCKNPMATKILRTLVEENYGKSIVLNIHPDSIYMGALGAALFALDDFNAGTAVVPASIRALYVDDDDGKQPVRVASSVETHA